MASEFLLTADLANLLYYVLNAQTTKMHVDEVVEHMKTMLEQLKPGIVHDEAVIESIVLNLCKTDDDVFILNNEDNTIDVKHRIGDHIVPLMKLMPKIDDDMVELRPSSIHGDGVFAKRTIDAGTIIYMAYIGTLNYVWNLDKTNEFALVVPALSSVVMVPNADDMKHVCPMKLNEARPLSNQNAQFYAVDGWTTVVRVTQKIEAGQELLVSYGPHFNNNGN